MARPTTRYAHRKIADAPVTHGGARAANITDSQQLRRSVLACMLYEDNFYEDGESVSTRISNLAMKLPSREVHDLAVEARQKHNLRHAPLLLALALARRGEKIVEGTLDGILQRADEPAEFLALLWQDGRCPIPHAVRRGIGHALCRFDEYQLAKWGRKGPITTKDVIKLCHPDPITEKRSELWARALKGELATPDTWEVTLSAGGDKKESWTRLLKENRLGALALLRNLRNMQQADVPLDSIRAALKNAKTTRVLPFRFITAAKHAPRLEPELEELMLRSMQSIPKVPGKTVLVVDVSGSMSGSLSDKSELSRLDAAAALTILAREVCEDVAIYATAGSDSGQYHSTELLPARRGFALRDAFQASYGKLGGGGIFLNQCMEFTHNEEKTADTVIVFTDEQDCDHKLNPITSRIWGKKNYLVNVANYRRGIGYGRWTHIDGFSERVLDYIAEAGSLQV